jgi:hypothetical protein
VEGAEKQPGPKDELLKLTVEQIGTDKVGDCLQLLESSSYGIDIAENVAFEVTAGRARWILLLNKKSVERNLISSLTGHWRKI